MYTELDDLEEQLLLAKELHYIDHLELKMNCAIVHFSTKVPFQTIHKIVRYINQTYKNVAWVPSSLYLTNPRRQITIHYKRDPA